MMKTTLASLAAIALAAPHHTQLNSLTYSFEDYEREFNKSYEDAEERQMRKAIFEKNLHEIAKVNSRQKSWHASVSPISDMSDAEFRALLGRKRSSTTHKMTFGAAPATPGLDDEIPLEQLPKHVDWRQRGVITPVKDQGACGSCYAFGAAATIESYWAIATGELTEVSPQQIVDCVDNPKKCGGTGGCRGGVESMAFEHVKTWGGIETQWRYWYHSGVSKDKGSCKTSPKAVDSNGRFVNDGTKPVSIADHGALPRNDYAAVMRHLAFVGPLSIGIDASQWKFYKGGVFKGCPSGNQRVDQNHAVQLVGYGEDPVEGPYWLVRNSWTPSWGERGYIRIERTTPDVTDHCLWDVTPQHGSACEGDNEPVLMCGACGILFEPTYVTINKKVDAPVNPNEQDEIDDDMDDEEEDPKKQVFSTLRF